MQRKARSGAREAVQMEVEIGVGMGLQVQWDEMDTGAEVVAVEVEQTILCKPRSAWL